MGTLIAVDPPGFGGSERRNKLMNPRAIGDFIVRIADAFRLDRPHLVAPDIGTSSTLFAASAHPGRFYSLVIGSGGAAVPINVTGVLKNWVEATDLEPYRRIGDRQVVEIALSTIDGYTPSDEIREDYMVAQPCRLHRRCGPLLRGGKARRVRIAGYRMVGPNRRAAMKTRPQFALLPGRAES
jgi:pimeloyl-ACP methyl ester carboxylesterase